MCFNCKLVLVHHIASHKPAAPLEKKKSLMKNPEFYLETVKPRDPDACHFIIELLLLNTPCLPFQTVTWLLLAVSLSGEVV